ncbi:MAG: hypothetical protein IIT39_06070 [Clostridia bacterium]|nr:hypothetical protein [Clostridia bacterium]
MNTKMTISIEEEFLKIIDEYADSHFMTRSGLVQLALNQFLQQQQIVDSWNRIADLMEQVAEKNEVTPEVKKELEDFERLARLFKRG